MKVQSKIVINVISARTILYLIINLSVKVLVECTVLEVPILVTALTLFTLLLEGIVQTSM